jgi:putative molybdopterin biosynthesis protein
VISTGNEIVPPGHPLDYGKIYDINAQTISDSIVENGGEPIQLGIVGDNPETMRSRLMKGLEITDMLITSGGTSAGIGDLLYRIINELGKPGIIVHGVSVKPGKPTIIAVLDGKPFFGLPGYPASALTIFDIFVNPVLREMAGLEPDVTRRKVNAKTAERFFTSGGRREFTPVNIVKSEDEGYSVYPVPGGSGAITSLAEADGFIEIPANRQFLESGERVTVRLFSHELKLADLTIIGSHCLGIDVVLELLRRRFPGINAKVINAGSSGGLAAVRRGEADIAGTHLLDDVTGEYNLPFIERFGIVDKTVLVRGYEREQGFIIEKSNPKRVSGIMDLLREGVSFVNRNPGSGTRVLLDSLLMSVAKEKNLDFEQIKSSIQGYGFEAKSHSAVAVAVLHGKADLGLGIRTVADRYGLDFIPVSKENFDFVISLNRLRRKPIKKFLETLKSEEFKKTVLDRVPGIIPTNETGRVIYPPEEQ